MNQYFDNFKQIAEKQMANSRALVEMNNKTYAELAEQFMAMANLMVETSSEQVSAFGKTKNYKEAISQQGEMISDLNGKLMGIFRNTNDIVSEYKENYGEWMDNTMKQNAEWVPSVKA